MKNFYAAILAIIISLVTNSFAAAVDEMGVPSVDEIEQQIQEQGIQDFEAPPAAQDNPNRFKVPVSGSNMADLTARMSYLEEEIRRLNGEVSALQFSLQKFANSANQAKIAKPSPELETNDSSEKYVSRPDDEQEKYVIKLGDKDLGGAEEVSAEEKAAFDEAVDLVSKQKLEAAQKKFIKFTEKYPKSANVDDAYFWLGEINLDAGKNKEAALSYLKSYRSDKNGNRAEEALLKSSIALGKLGKKEEACKSLSTLKTMPDVQELIKNQATSESIKFGCK